MSPRPGRAPGVVFWWNSPSQHMAPCLREFAGLWPGEVRAVWCRPLSEDRRRLGWRMPDFGRLPHEQLPANEAEARRRTADLVAAARGSIHVYCGMKAVPRVYAAYREARTDASARHVVIAEPFRGWGVRRFTRHVRAFLQSLAFRGRVDALLAMGEAGVAFYRQVGFAPERVYPFIYQSPAGAASGQLSAHAPLRLVYIGKFETRKGLLDLLTGLGRTTEGGWQLTVVGDGPERNHVRDVVERAGIAERVTWRGIVAHENLIDELPHFDVAVVPSRFDGWGTVSNEALQAGLAVVVSDACSSSDLVRYSGAGLVVQARRSAALARAVDSLVANPDVVRAMKQRARDYAGSIGGGSVAAYLASVLERIAGPGTGAPPRAPWASGSPQALVGQGFPR